MKKYLISALLIAGTTLIAAPAMARVDVDVNLGLPGLYVQPAPVYVQPSPVYVRPAPVYVQPAPVYVQPRPQYYNYDNNWREQRHHRHGRGRHDRDGDGVPNRYDQRPNDPRRY